MSVTRYRILQMLSEGASVTDIQGCLTGANLCSRQDISDELASLLECDLVEPSGFGIMLTPRGQGFLQEGAGELSQYACGPDCPLTAGDR